jgi:hypothetical protein
LAHVAYNSLQVGEIARRRPPPKTERKQPNAREAQHMHTIELLATGADMRRKAEARCANVNEAHFMVHEAMMEALADPAAASPRAARESLFARLDRKLSESVLAREGGMHAFVGID